SAVTAFAVLWIAVLAAYALIRYLLHRTLPVVALFLVLLAILGQVNPYKMRFPGLDQEYKVTEGKVVHLEELLARDLERQEKLLEYWQTLARKNDVDATQVAFQALKSQMDDLARHFTFGTELADRPGRIAQLLPDRVELVKKLNEVDYDPELRRLREQMNQNRVIPRMLVYATPDRAADESGGNPDHPILCSIYRMPEYRPLDTGRPDTDKHPVVIVTVSGGGLRSAAWTFRVLARMEEEFARKGIDL